jgi:hypothetical protein
MLKNYNKAIPPISGRRVMCSKAGTDVGLQLRFFKLESDAAHGNMRVNMRVTAHIGHDLSMYTTFGSQVIVWLHWQPMPLPVHLLLPPRR